MRPSKAMISNFVIKLSSDLYSRLGMLVITVFIARVYSLEEFGTFALAFAIVNMFYIATEMGLHVIFIKDASGDISRSKEHWERVLVLKLFACAFSAILILMISYVLNYSSETILIIFIAVFWMLGNSVIDLINSYFIAMENAQFVLYNTLIYRTALYISIGIAVLKNVSIVLITQILALSSIFGMITGLLFLFSQIGAFRIRIDKTYITGKLKESAPLAISSVMISIYLRLDTILLSRFTDETQVGLYNSAFKLFETLIFIPAVFQTIILPRLVSYVDNMQQFRDFTVKAFSLILILALPIVLVFSLRSRWVMELLYGPKYQQAEIVLMILAPAVLLMFLYCVPAIILIAKGRQTVNAWASFWALLLNTIGNLILIPRLGFTGASIMVVCTQLVMFLYLGYHSRESFLGGSYIKLLMKLAMVTLISGGCLYYLDLGPVLLEILLSVVAYFILLLLFRVITKELFVDLFKVKM